ncbi:dipeptidase [Alteromonas ponticola]|uniref:dipeptidase n=1 Tax=Alteromonas ponticola TaxID=2720613 RepID=UPI0031B611BE
MITAGAVLAWSQLTTAAIEVSEQAQTIAKETIIVDGHIDVPYRLREKWADVTQATDDGDFDYPRAVAGGLNAPFMSIYVPASLDGSDASTQLAHQLIDSVEAIVARAPDKFAIAYTTNDVKEHFTKGLISLPMGMENGSPIQGDLNNLRIFYDRGIRYITLAHSQSNHISDSSYDLRRQWKGLSPFGKTLIPAMNNIGMLIDISHVSDDAFYQTLKLSESPVIASHSSLRKFTPGFERNMNDDMIKALAENGGVIMINFGSSFVTKEARQWRDGLAKAENALLKKEGKDSPKLADFEATYRKDNPYPYSTIDEVLDHIDHVVKLVGIEHVGLGSDFDGVGDSLPIGLKDVSYFPHLVQGLLNRGYKEDEIKKILSGNVLRVWEEVEDYAKKHG